MHSDITFIASDLLAAEKVQNILRESPANCQVVLSNTQDLEEVSRSQVAQATIRPGSPSSTGSRLYSSRPGIPRSERPSLWPSPIWKSGRMNPRPGPP